MTETARKRAPRELNPSAPSALRAEVEHLQNQIVAQSAELWALRWELSVLLRSTPGARRVRNFRQKLRAQFPKAADKVRSLTRRTRRHLTAFFRKKNTWHKIDNKGKFPTPLLAIVAEPLNSNLRGSVPVEQLILLDPGAGQMNTVPVPLDDEPPLRRPTPGSFAHWLVQDRGGLGRIGTVIVDALDSVSLSLLRGRLQPDQMLGIANFAQANRDNYDRDASHFEDSGISFFTQPPLAFKDQLDRDLKVNPDIVPAFVWPKISVVMVSFNQASFLEEGINSVLEQGYPNLEILFIDGGSTDGSLEIIQRYQEHFDFLLIEPDDGQADGLNKGFKRATGEIFTWLNSDDLFEPGALFRVGRSFADYQVDMVVGGCRQIGLSRSHVINNHHTKLPFGRPVALPLGLLLDIDRFWLTGNFFYQPEVFFSKRIWLRSGGRLRTDLYYSLDYDLWVRMAGAGATILHIPEFLACSRTHTQQKTAGATPPYLPELRRLQNEYGKLLTTLPQLTSELAR